MSAESLLPFFVTLSTQNSQHKLFAVTDSEVIDDLVFCDSCFFVFVCVFCLHQNRHRSDNHVNNRKAEVLIDRK